MDFTVLSTICDVVILIGAVVLAIERICAGIGKPWKFAKKKNEEQTRALIKQVLNEVLPEILEERDIQTRDKYRADRQRYLEEIQKEVLANIAAELSQVTNLDQKYEVLACSARDVLREKIMMLYHKNKKDRKLSWHEREALTQYYKDYKAMNGNSYIDRYYARMSTWAVDEDDYEDDE